MSIFSWTLLGLLFGFITFAISNTPAKGGIVGMLTIGTLGTLTAGYLANIMFGLEFSGFNMHSLIIGIAGAISLMMLSKTFMKI